MQTINLFPILAAILILASCAPQSQEGIKIGASLALTGSLARLGIPEKNGLEMAVEDINQKGGINNRKIQLIIEDNQGDAKAGVTTAEKLINMDKVDFFFTAFTHIAQAAAPIAQNASTVMVYQSTVPDIAQKYSMVFKDYYDFGDHGQAIAELMLAQERKTIAYLGENSEVCQKFLSRAKSAFSNNHVVLATEQTYDPGQTDFKTQLLKVEESKPDAILLCVWRNEDIVMRQMDELNLLGIQTYHAAAIALFPTGEVTRYYEKNHAISSGYGYSEKDSSPAVTDFVNRYQVKYGVKPLAEALYAYEVVLELDQALTPCPQKDAACLINELTTRTFSVPSGNLSFGKDRVSTRPSLLIQFKDGNWTDI